MELKEINNTIFESIKHIDEERKEYWLARELMGVLDYKKWERFSNTIDSAKETCKNSGYDINDHFPGVGKLINIGKGGKRKVDDYLVILIMKLAKRLERQLLI